MKTEETIIKYVEKQERAYWFKQKQNLNNLMSKDPKKFWNRLNMKSKGKPHNFSKIELSKYFKNLTSSSELEQRNNQENEPENLTNLLQDIDSILNRTLDLHEVKTMIDKLKDKRLPELTQLYLNY